MERAGANGIASARSSFCSSFVMAQYRIVFNFFLRVRCSINRNFMI